MATRTCKLEYMMRNFNSDDKKEIMKLLILNTKNPLPTMSLQTVGMKLN